MDVHHKLWNEQQKAFQHALWYSGDHQLVVELFLQQHAMVHSGQMSQSGLWSFEDEIWQGLNKDAFRIIPKNGEHSLAWIFWHMARIEDVTMNILVADAPQLLIKDNWLKKLKTTQRDTGNGIDLEAITELSSTLNMDALRNYRIAVGRRTREIVQQLHPEQLKEKVNPARLQRILEEGAVIEAAKDLIAYWGRHTISGLLLMPPTRHNLVHLNEALRVKQKVMRELKA